MNKILITSALPYVNNIPHLGNIVGSTLSADVYARFLKMIGYDVFFLCGSDEYGTTTEVKAMKEGLSCEEICNKYHYIHKSIYDWFNIKFDVFGRTSTNVQTEITHEIFFDLYRNGHIESKEIEQKYCIKCDLYLADRYLQGYCYSDKCKYLKNIANGDQCDICGNHLDQIKFTEYWCSICHEKPEIVKTKHLYLKLNSFRDKLKEYFLSDKSKVQLTNNAKCITKSFLEKDLEPRCITRDLKWGTSVPGMLELKKYLSNNDIGNIDFSDLPNLDEFKGKVFYVWFDAPIGYLSILKGARPTDWLDWLKGEIIQLMAKDNILFHTVIFPATLLGSNPEKYPLVTGISCTEYLDYQGQKFSKSKDVGIFGDNVIKISERLQIDENYWRYYLMRIRPENHDSSFNWEDFFHIVRGELAFKIGNFINRCMTMSYRYIEPHNGFIETKFNFNDLDEDTNTFAKIVNITTEYIFNFKQYKFKDALLCANSLAELGNGFIQKYTIWNVCKEDINNGSNLLGCANYITSVLIKLLSPFMPNKYETLSKNFIHNVDIQNILSTGSVNISNDNYEIPFKPMDIKIIKELVGFEKDIKQDI